MSYSKGPYSEASSLPAPQTTKVHSSRKLNFVTRRYELDDDGNPLPQQTIQQVVALTVAFNLPNEPLITDQDIESRRQAIFTLLADLTAPPNPQITGLAVDFQRDGAGAIRGTITFTDTSTGLDQTVEL